VRSWREAQQYNCLSQYFEAYDIFEASKGVRGDFVCHYAEDYFDYLNETFTLKERAILYKNYLERTSRKVDYVEVDYRLQVTDSYYISQSQMPQYEYVLKQFDKVALPSDGIGMASVYCILKDIDYVSWEPGGVGNMARKLGIITSDRPVYDESCTYVFFYCVQYYKLPMFLGQRFVVWDVVHVSKPGKLLMPEVSSNCGIDMEEWKRQHFSRYMLLESGYPLDSSAKQMMRTLGVVELSLDRAQYLIATAQSTVEALLSGGFYTIDFQKTHRSREFRVKTGGRDYDKIINKRKKKENNHSKNR